MQNIKREFHILKQMNCYQYWISAALESDFQLQIDAQCCVQASTGLSYNGMSIMKSKIKQISRQHLKDIIEGREVEVWKKLKGS